LVWTFWKEGIRYDNEKEQKFPFVEFPVCQNNHFEKFQPVWSLSKIAVFEGSPLSNSLTERKRGRGEKDQRVIGER